jgi:hypothetical protein
MSVYVDKDSYLPNYNAFDVFQYKLPFVFLLIFVIVAFIFLFSIFNRDNTNSENSKIPTLILEIILFSVLIVVIVLNFKWLHDNKYSFSAELTDLFSHKLTNIDIKKDGDDHDISHNHVKDCKNEDDGEVFHITENRYTYSSAKEVCSALDARLATYDEVEDAYKNGANWCSYGWSDEQMALFPIQKSVYNDLKKIKGHQHDCGRPGVNGGYIENKNSTFGVNCYGKKPYITDKDKEFMEKYSYSPSISDASYNKVNEVNKEDDVNDLLISPFNKSTWSFD